MSNGCRPSKSAKSSSDRGPPAPGRRWTSTGLRGPKPGLLAEPFRLEAGILGPASGHRRLADPARNGGHGPDHVRPASASRTSRAPTDDRGVRGDGGAGRNRRRPPFSGPGRAGTAGGFRPCAAVFSAAPSLASGYESDREAAPSRTGPRRAAGAALRAVRDKRAPLTRSRRLGHAASAFGGAPTGRRTRRNGQSGSAARSECLLRSLSGGSAGAPSARDRLSAEGSPPRPAKDSCNCGFG